MKKYASINLKISFLCSLFVLAACQGVYVPDPIDPRLPKFTEEGNNVAGAWINDDLWASSVESRFTGTGVRSFNEPLIMANATSDSLVVSFFGSLGSVGNQEVEFCLTAKGVSDFAGFRSLSGKKITLDGAENTADIKEPFSWERNLRNVQGQVYFKRIGANPDPEKGGIVMSGTFGFSGENAAGEEVSVTYGRFDYRISEGLNFREL